jgi:hypothetical protein
VVPKVAGTAIDYVSLWPAGGTQPFVSTLDDPQGLIVSNAVIVPAGTPAGGISVYNAGPSITDVIIDMNGYFAVPSDENSSTALGTGALQNNTTGQYNAAIGAGALQSNTVGASNTASGSLALQANTGGAFNTANGAIALANNTTGCCNTASGFDAMANNSSGGDNTATGYQALSLNTTGGGETPPAGLTLCRTIQ